MHCICVIKIRTRLIVSAVRHEFTTVKGHFYSRRSVKSYLPMKHLKSWGFFLYGWKTWTKTEQYKNLKKTKQQQTTNLQSCLKLADIAVPQAPAAANYKQIWCWVTEIPWPHGGIMRKVSDSPLFSVFHPEGTNTPSYGPRFLYQLHGETDRSAVG